MTAVALGPLSRGVAERDVAGAAGNVEQLERRFAARRIEHGDEVALPQPVQATRHQVVHQVVAPGDGRQRPD